MDIPPPQRRNESAEKQIWGGEDRDKQRDDGSKRGFLGIIFLCLPKALAISICKFIPNQIQDSRSV